jgi:hypothetical protein
MSQGRSSGGVDIAARTSDAVLVLPDGWVVDPIARERLSHQLARADARYSGVVAPLADVPSGASYRTSAERAALAPHPRITATDGGAVRGAVLLRPDVDFDVLDGLVKVEGELLADPGAAVHDPWGGVGALSSASTEGRPPFPYRPVVVFLGLDADPDLSDWVRLTVNALVRQGTEGRVAVPEPTDGFHLTRPCAPTEDSIAALAPDAVVALDETAVDLGSRWLGHDRSAVVIELTQETSDAIELVSWRIGEVRGRLRARIGRGVSADALAGLVRRLCAGPQPLPPRDRTWREQTVRRPSRTVTWTRGGLDPPPRAMALLGAPEERARFAGFADHLDALGGGLAVYVIAGRVPDGALAADVVILRSVRATEGVEELIRARRRAGRRTVVDVAASDVRHTGDSLRSLTLEDDAGVLLDLAGFATTTSRRLRDWLRARALRAFVLPTLLTRGRVSSLRARREQRKGRGRPILGWHTGPPGGKLGPARVAVADAVRELLADHPELSVELVGGHTAIAECLGHPARVMARRGDPSASTVARWTVQCQTTSAGELAVSDDPTPVVDAAFLGVPTILAVEDPVVKDGLVAPWLAVSDASDAAGWRRVLEPLLSDGEVWSLRSAEASRLADALYGPATSMAILNRFFGWLRHGRAP